MPTEGIEPPTPCLQGRSSSAELRRQGPMLPNSVGVGTRFDQGRSRGTSGNEGDTVPARCHASCELPSRRALIADVDVIV